MKLSNKILSTLGLALLLSSTAQAARYSEDVLSIFSTHCKKVERYQNYSFNSEKSNCKFPKNLNKSIFLQDNFNKDTKLVNKVKKTLQDLEIEVSGSIFQSRHLEPSNIYFNKVIKSYLDVGNYGDIVRLFYEPATNQLIIGKLEFVETEEGEVAVYTWKGDLSNKNLINAIVYNEFYMETGLNPYASPNAKINISKIKRELNLGK